MTTYFIVDYELPGILFSLDWKTPVFLSAKPNIKSPSGSPQSYYLLDRSDDKVFSTSPNSLIN